MYGEEELQKKLDQVTTILLGDEARYRSKRVEALEKVAESAREYQRSREYCERMSRFYPDPSQDLVHGWIRNVRTAESNLFYALSQLKEVEEDHE